MRTNLATVLDPNRRSNDAGEFETALRRRIVGQELAIEKVVEIFQMFLAGLNAPPEPFVPEQHQLAPVFAIAVVGLMKPMPG